MSIDPKLLEILACPECKAEIELLPDEAGLKCQECQRIYPIRDGIPVMLVEEARMEDDKMGEETEETSELARE